MRELTVVGRILGCALEVLGNVEERDAAVLTVSGRVYQSQLASEGRLRWQPYSLGAGVVLQ